jgi:hypothetical protein
LSKKLSHGVVHRAVLALPLRYREPVVLFYFHEMDVAAAARTLGMPEGTLKARLSRARALLRQRFPGLDEDSHPFRTKRGMDGAQSNVASHPSRKNKNAARVGHPDFYDNKLAQETTGKKAAQ